MSKSLMKPFVIVLVVVALFAVVLGFAAKKEVSLGSEIHFTQDDFKAGIKVDGTEIINSAGEFVGAIAGSTGTFSGAVTALANVLAPAGDATLTAAQSGSIVKMNTAGQDITLPTASASVGAVYRFVVTAAVATTNMTIVAAPADTIEGTLIVAGAVVDCDAADIITFVIDGENIGDFVELYTDGTSWLIGDSGVLTASKMTCSG